MDNGAKFDKPTQRLTLDDVLRLVFQRNLNEGRVFIKFSMLKDFFEDISSDLESWSTEQISSIVRRGLVHDELDGALMRLEISGILNHSNDRRNVYEMGRTQEARALSLFNRLNAEEKAAIQTVAERYSDYLCARCPISYRQCAGQCIGFLRERGVMSHGNPKD
jgi:hypothetical protein